MRSVFRLLLAVGVIALVTVACGVGAQPERSPQETRGKRGQRVEPKRFTGSMRIRQEEGTLYYDFEVKAGKVTHGICAHLKRKGVLYDIVGGWYDGERLMLLLQARGNNLKDQWFAHAHQFRRVDDGFELEHTLFGYGKTIDSGIVYTRHVIDRITEAE